MNNEPIDAKQADQLKSDENLPLLPVTEPTTCPALETLQQPIVNENISKTTEAVENLEALVANLPGEFRRRFSDKSQPLPPLFYELKVKLREGINLAVRDINGTSDPYVKFILNGNCIYKSKIIFKNLNPVWNEEFTVKLSRKPSGKLCDTASLGSLDSNNSLDFVLAKYKLKMFVYDYDRGFLNDDLIGYSDIDLFQLKDAASASLQLQLEDKSLSKFEYLGLVALDLGLTPRYDSEQTEDLDVPAAVATGSSSKSNATVSGRRQCVLNVVLVEGRGLKPMDDNGLSDPYVKFRIDGERYRSKTIRKTLNPRFEEQFQLYIHDMNAMSLHVEVFDFDTMNKSDDMGRAVLDLTKYELDKTHFIQLPLGDAEFGTVSMYLTLTGLSYSAVCMDSEYISDASFQGPYQDEIAENYGVTFKDTLVNFSEVGWLRVKVIRAEGLASADINGKSDPFCTLSITSLFLCFIF